MINNVEIVEIINNQPMTNSLKIAEVFGKRHKNILSGIKSLKCSQEFNELNFKLVNYTDCKGEQRPMYNITKDGFVFLVMGYTGEKACRFKELYIKTFNEMAEKLRNATAEKNSLIQDQLEDENGFLNFDLNTIIFNKDMLMKYLIF